MGSLRDYVMRWFAPSRPRLSQDTAEQLRVAFKERYHHFQLLLSANKQALEQMAEIESALRGKDPFGMAFVRSSCTAIAACVQRMIRSMAVLAPDRYAALTPRFREIQGQIQALLTPPPRTLADTDLVVPLETLNNSWRERSGAKMANLGEIHQHLNLRIPDGFVITAAAYERFLKHSGLQDEINRLIQSADREDTAGLLALSSRLQQSVSKAPIPSDLEGAIAGAWRVLTARHGQGLTVAMRSSSLLEDSDVAAFAGQFRTELNVSRAHLLEAYRTVVASKYSLQALTYRLNRGFRDEDLAVAVGCMAMVAATAGGVAYSTSPVNPDDRSVHIDATWGLPKAIVDGSAAFDSFTVARTPQLQITRKAIGPKTDRLVCFPEEGICRRETTGEKANRPCLTSEQVLAVARTALDIEAHYGQPQDMEWALAPDGGLMVLQCRPLVPPAAVSAVEDPAAVASTAEVLLTGGVTASPGAACGPAFPAVKNADALRFPAGGILVVRQAAPHWATLIGRAAGVVSEQGGVAGHLANVAREFGVPALFGCPDAMTRLASAGEITLDADRGQVYAGRIEGLLKPLPKAVNPMVNSPVYQLLEQLGRLIIPLHLLDPAAREFQPQNCRTLHDITRFLHEKSVHEMFSFGKEHRFPERSSKQLFYKVPMQWWVLNLDDGFAAEVSSKYVPLDQIASEPMLAFWEGFTAIPWAGPPSIDRRGFASVLFQSTANTALTPGLKSRYAEKNYFMIARNYCNLSSRLGYHFAMMEALVSERTPENYVTFQFKGGAADLPRRLKRVHFIGDLLEGYGFRVSIQEDHLIARIENDVSRVMYERLKILGYLALHTRQIDMIMANSQRVKALRAKIVADIDGVLLASAA